MNIRVHMFQKYYVINKNLKTEEWLEKNTEKSLVKWVIGHIIPHSNGLYFIFDVLSKILKQKSTYGLKKKICHRNLVGKVLQGKSRWYNECSRTCKLQVRDF